MKDECNSSVQWCSDHLLFSPLVEESWALNHINKYVIPNRGLMRLLLFSH